MIEIIHYKDVNDKPAFMVDFGYPVSIAKGYYTYHYMRNYYSGNKPPNHPVPARINAFDFVAAYPMGPKEDFYDIGLAGLKLLD